MLSWCHPSPQFKLYLDRFSRFRAAHGRASLYFTTRRPFSRQNCPFSRGIWTPSNTWFLGLFEPITLTASRSVQPFLHSSPQSVPILCNGRPPSKLPFPMGTSEPNVTHGSLSQLEFITQMASLSVQPFLQCSRLWQTDRLTDRPRYSVCNNRPHLQYRYVRSTAMRPDSLIN